MASRINFAATWMRCSERITVLASPPIHAMYTGARGGTTFRRALDDDDVQGAHLLASGGLTCATEADCPLLVAHFVTRFNAQLGRSVARVAPQLLASLRACPWPGNVRELRNVVENMVLFCSGDELTLADLPPEYREGSQVEVREAPGEWTPRPMAEIEKEAILRTLELTEGHRARAAQLLGIGLRTLQRKLKEYGAVPGGEEIEE